MVNVLVIYYSRTGNTKAMAEEVARGARDAGANVKLRSVDEVKLEDLVWAHGIIIGSPTYFGLPATPIKKLIDESVKIRGKLEGKVGAAFSSSFHRAGGRETTMLAILQAMLIHGMIVCGDPLSTGGHYGAAANGAPDEQAKRECYALGRRVAEIARKLFE
ncbi:MAG: NAD(P)H-dependent oxidoreductase [Candidatus Nezhaarchaeales archaeon]|nr:MAG: flavodoxin family protein [Candidatus Nezhaarchaeota archaeon WYZ-LMO8]TDA35463.1 MAG: flavodoxin family protein [Candidatus Nezhaarchaeota archaeon WYZ-LMO7]